MPTIAEVRAQYPQYSDMSDTDLAGALHDKFYSDMPADQFAAKIGLKAPDPVSINDVGRALATGVPIVGGALNKINAATNAALAPALNGFFDERNQLNEPNWSERYAHSLRDQEGADHRFSEEHPIINTGANIVGGTAAMVPLVAAAPTLMGATGNLATKMGLSAGSNALIGGADSAIRNGDAVGGTLTGGAIGAAVPALGAVASRLAGPIAARFNPERFANSQIARAVSESGQTPAQLEAAVRNAAAEGQGQFTLADALGNPGGRMLSTVTRSPGEGRTQATATLNNRQDGQGRRISGFLAEGFDSPQTAAQTEARLTGARGAAADAEYGAVRNDAGPVNVQHVIDHIDANVPVEPAAPDTISGRMQRYRRMLSNGDAENPQNLTDFEQVQRVRSELSDEIQNARQSGQGNRARMLNQVLTRLDTSLENSSNGFRQANANFSQASRDIDAIGAGTQAYRRGRTADILGDFNALRPEARQAFRAGYVDPAIQEVHGAAPGVNKARGLLNDAFQDEAAAMAPGNDLMRRRIAREQTMFETRGQALGNSKTAENLADDAAMGALPSLVGQLVSGNWSGAARAVIASGSNAITGNTPQVRAAVARVLLQSGANLDAAALNALVSRTVSQLQTVQRLARSSAGAVTTTANQANHKPKRIMIFKETK